MKVVECVPNFSEGRRKDVIDALADAIRSVESVRLLDIEFDPDHNRSVFTFIGEPQDVKTRRCLMCRDSFESSWPGERVCKRCKSTAAWREG